MAKILQKPSKKKPTKSADKPTKIIKNQQKLRKKKPYKAKYEITEKPANNRTKNINNHKDPSTLSHLKFGEANNASKQQSQPRRHGELAKYNYIRVTFHRYTRCS